MFTMRLPNADYAADLFKAIAAVVDEGSFKVTQDSLRLVSMDPAHVSLVDFELRKEAAEEFEVDRETELTVNLQELLKFLKRAKKGESITLVYDDEKRKLNIVLTDPTKSRERRYQLNTLEPVATTSASPRLAFEGRARVNAEALWEAIEDASLVSDAVRIIIQPAAVVLTAKGDMGVVENKLTKDGALVYEVEASTEVVASFSLAYLERIVRPGKDLSEETLIQLSSNKPIKLTFTLPAGRLEYLVAPRLE
ncbi:MAG: proliferating cell nuclear antigen (pcna) [Nitrososphaerota archaeon]